MSEIASIVEWTRELVQSGGYPMLAVMVFVENVFPPIPSEVILPLAGFYVGEGALNYPLAVAAATLGSVAGAMVLYELARRGGRPALLRYGRWLRVSQEDLDRADEWFDRSGGWVVLGGRLVPGVRSLVSIPAGLSETPRGQFVLLTAAGSGAWNAALIGAGWALGRDYERVGELIGPVAATVLALVFALLAVWLVRRMHSE